MTVGITDDKLRTKIGIPEKDAWRPGKQGTLLVPLSEPRLVSRPKVHPGPSDLYCKPFLIVMLILQVNLSNKARLSLY